jgi:hypothetical protein
MMTNINPKSIQEANALLALRNDTKRELLSDLSELDNEIKMLENYIKQENDKKQWRLNFE